MNHITLRGYAAQDWPRIEAIHDAARRHELQLAGLDDAWLPLAIAAEEENLFEYHLCVAELDGQVRGFAAWSEDELTWLYVDPAYTRRGIGRALVRHVLEQLPSQTVHVEVLAGNEPALRLYESEGFEQDEIRTGQMPGNERFTVSAHCLSRRAD